MSLGQACILWDMVSIRTGLAGVPVIPPMGEPNTPLAFRRRDVCHSKQQAGHGKITAGFGQAQKIPSLVLPTMTLVFCS